MSNSVFLNQANEGKNTWWRTLLVIISIFVGQVIGTASYEIYYIKFNPNLSLKTILDFSNRNESSTYIEILVIFLATLLSFWFCYQWLHKRSIKSTIFVGNKFSWSLYFQGFITNALILILALLLTAQDELKEFIIDFDITYFVPIALLGFLCFGIQSFTEEVLFRGYAFQLISRNRIHLFFALILQSTIFGLLHLPSGLANFLNATAIGIAFSFITIWHNRIEFASGAHNANNLMIALVLGGIGDELSKPFDPNIYPIDLIISIISMLVLLIFAYNIGNKGQLEKVID